MCELKIKFFQGQSNLLSEVTNNNEDVENKSIDIIKNKISELFNMKNIHFLFGSGTSATAIPTMAELYDKVETHINSLALPLNKFIKEEFIKITKRVNDKNLEDVLGILYSHRVYLNDGDIKNSAFIVCESLIDIIETIIFDNINIDFDDATNKDNIENYQRFYRKTALRNKDLSRINVFTTNNDLFNETALDSLNIHYINGFNGGLNRYFNPALFNYTFSKRMDTSIDKFEPVENMVHLYKIHGSINWIEDKKNANTFFKIKEIFNPTKTNNNVLVYPAPTKQNKSLGSPYVEMFREFQRKLLEPLSVLFVVGYSFSDEHVNNIIYQALATNSTMNLVIINDVSDRDISKIEDDRIFKIWGENLAGNKIHYFDYVVENLLPNVNAFKSENSSLNEFVKFYNENLDK
ncbi:SIR2 family protein [Flavobacterium algicola]|uniref:SIR2 family protein n=1 Tax=Flavobacterium algicola TaxID=556529 RepID=UPI001EFEA5C9|nr:SIR2 family protein [Flavobacterium algicola]MCG9793422.1 SIR2 family protein [Flavobacterium algicola]